MRVVEVDGIGNAYISGFIFSPGQPWWAKKRGEQGKRGGPDKIIKKWYPTKDEFPHCYFLVKISKFKIAY